MFPSLAKLADAVSQSGASFVVRAANHLVSVGYLERVEVRIAPTRKSFSRRVFGSVRAVNPQEVSRSDDFKLMHADDLVVRQRINEVTEFTDVSEQLRVEHLTDDAPRVLGTGAQP